VTFPDPNLDHYIRQATGVLPGYPIYQSYLDFGYFDASGAGIVNLSGLEYCTNLVGLDLSMNQISNLGPISALTNLIELDLSGNQISDVGPLGGLLNLGHLRLNDNLISNIAPLAGLTNLMTLELNNNQISAIPPLPGLTSLTELYLEGNQISDISGLKDPPDVAMICLRHNQISDITPLVDNPGIGSQDYIQLESNPLNDEAITIWIPALEARGVYVSWDAYATLTGHVEDGFGHRLGGVKVQLIGINPVEYSAPTITDSNGVYTFEAWQARRGREYKIRVELATDKFSIYYDTYLASGETDAFQVMNTEIIKNIDFNSVSFNPTVPSIPTGRLDDLALMYYHVKQIVDFEADLLGVVPDLNLPIQVWAFKSGTDKVYYSYLGSDRGNITIGANDGHSDSNDRDRPMNREWHEMFHELMDDTVVMPPRPPGDTNHAGYINSYTTDSWEEGWAEFWPCVLKAHVGGYDWHSLDWRVYEWRGGDSSLEYNWKSWDFTEVDSEEEFAVASLLVDLVDAIDPADDDFISLNSNQLWQIIGTQHLEDMFQVYVALIAAGVGQVDTDLDGITDLDELFIAHGFYADTGNGRYDPGEAVGWGGTPFRMDKPVTAGASIRIIAKDSLGNPINDGTLMVDVVFPSPSDIYNYSYEVPLLGSDDQVGFCVAPDSDEATITMRVRDADGNLSGQFTVSNIEYWNKVKESTTGYAIEHTFVIGEPTVSSFSPADNAIGVAVDANLVMTFNENMAKGTGNIVIKKSSDDSVVETIDVTSGLVTISANTVTINPAGDLASSAGYYVQIASGALTDTASPTPNAYPGISDNTTWNFTTAQADTTPPVVTIDQAVGQADPTKDSPINFTVVFSESVSDFVTGDVTLSGTAGATTAVVTGSGTTYNIAVSGMTSNGTVIATIGAGVAHDAVGNPNTTSTSTDNQVTYVVDPTTLIDKLIAIVQGHNLQKGLENSLVTKLQNARKSLSGGNASQRQDALNKLEAFNNECEAQRNKGLSPEQADTLIARANEIIAILKQ
jgi:hypothetical protein